MSRAQIKPLTFRWIPMHRLYAQRVEIKALNAFSRAVGPKAPFGPLRAQRAHHSETIGIFPGASLRQALSSAAAVDLLCGA